MNWRERNMAVIRGVAEMAMDFEALEAERVEILRRLTLAEAEVKTLKEEIEYQRSKILRLEDEWDGGEAKN